MYLKDAEVRDFLRDISSHAAGGSEIVVDHFNPFFDPPNNEANARLVAMLKSWGEPWIFAIKDGEEESFLASAGWKLAGHTSLLVTSEDARKYIVRQDGTTVGDVQFPAPGTPQRTVHWLARART
jgi:O-methyltransferase involved in polyketide biosynthesis